MEQKQKKKGTPPPRYNEAFKAGTVRNVTEQGRESREVAKDLGICIDTLCSWLKAAGVQLGQVSHTTREQQRIRESEAEIRAMCKQLVEKDEVIDILKKNPSAFCRNHSGPMPLHPDVAPPGNPCGAGMPGPEDLTQRLLWPGAPQPLCAGAEESGASAEIDGTAPKRSRPGPGQSLPPAQAGIRLSPQACPPADAACGDRLCEMPGLQSHHQLPALPPLAPNLKKLLL